MRTTGKRTTAVLFLVAVCSMAWFATRSGSHSEALPTEAAPPSTGRRSTDNAEADATREREMADSHARMRVLRDWADILSWLRSSPAPTEEQIRARLMDLRKEWARMDPQALAGAIDQLLKSGEDAPTGMEFSVGLRGFLSGWPSMRVFLMDMLGISDPEMASAIARGILDQTDSPDEFAAGMRSLTREGLGRADNGELLDRFGRMLARKDWSGSRAFAEAMDLPRLLGSTDAAATLVQWAGNPALKAMAMDEFAAEHPAAMMEAMKSEEFVPGIGKANLMARANPSDPSQIEAVDTYLRDPALSEEDASAFLKVFPLRSATTGFRLYSGNPAPYAFEQIRAGDKAAYDQVVLWQQDPALRKYQPQLAVLADRLQVWIEQADRVDEDE